MKSGNGVGDSFHLLRMSHYSFGVICQCSQTVGAVTLDWPLCQVFKTVRDRSACAAAVKSSPDPISRGGTAQHPQSWAGLSTELQFLNKDGRISQRGKWGGGLGDFIERYDTQVLEYQRACYSIENPLC